MTAKSILLRLRLRMVIPVFLGLLSLSVYSSGSILLTKDAIEISTELYPLDSKSQKAQFTHLLKDLRCLVCQNQDLSDSNAPLAKDLRSQVYDMIKDHKSDSEIILYLTDRYGDFILFKPPLKPITYFLWLSPLLFLFMGMAIFLRTCMRSKRDA